MIHLPEKVVNTLIEAIYTNDRFAAAFTDYEPELFRSSREYKIYETNKRYSLFEANKLLVDYKWFKAQKNLTLDKIKKRRKDRKYVSR